ncbi:MAG: GHMP kinase [Fimbriimonadia bacterium]|jgi:galactokinase
MGGLDVKAPGRICLFGEHQDYLGLPVVAAAITRYIFVSGEPGLAQELEIELPDLGTTRTLSLSRENTYESGRDYLASCVNVLLRQGVRWQSGYRVRISGDIPQQAGVSSSSALVVAWMKFLLRAAGDARGWKPGELARLGHAAEVTEFCEPGGMMDHFAASYGGVIWVDTRPPFACRPLKADIEGIILCHSGQPKATIETLATARKHFTDALQKARALAPHLDIASTPIEEMRRLTDDLSIQERDLLECQWISRDLTPRGLQALEEGASPAILGRLLTAHHEQLRRLGVSTDRIDAILDAALATGAVGGKVNGSGGGGCLFVLAPGREEPVMRAMRSAGGTPWYVEVARMDDVQPE